MQSPAAPVSHAELHGSSASKNGAIRMTTFFHNSMFIHELEVSVASSLTTNLRPYILRIIRAVS